MGGGRIAYIDALRGFTMLLVVFWHVEYVTYGVPAFGTVINSILMSFRMPLFFFVSGYIAYKAVDRWNVRFFVENLRKKALVQLVPTIVFFSVLRIYMGDNPLRYAEKGFEEYWFTFVLFEMFAIYFTLSLIGRYVHAKIVDWGLIAISGIMVLALALFRFDFDYWEIWDLVKLTKYFQFFAFGILCRKYGSVFMKYVRNDCFRLGVILAFVASLVICFDDEFKETMSKTYWALHDVVMRYAGLLLVFIFFFGKEAYFESGARLSRMLRFVGRRTLDIYMLHYFMIPAIRTGGNGGYLAPFIDTDSMAMTRFAVSMAVAVLVVAACLFVSEVIRTSPALAHYLFGAKKRSINQN